MEAGKRAGIEAPVYEMAHFNEFYFIMGSRAACGWRKSGRTACQLSSLKSDAIFPIA